jgi:hypothetical protein
MKNIKRKIATLVCGVALLCGVTFTASAMSMSGWAISNGFCIMYHFSFSNGNCSSSVSGVACGQSDLMQDLIFDSIDDAINTCL